MSIYQKIRPVTMTGNGYQKQAMRTNDGVDTDRLVNAIEHGRDSGIKDTGDLLLACLGIAGEAGETIDIVKKHIFHQKPLDTEHLKKELGDIMWYIALFADAMGWDVEDVMRTNIAKLNKRYQHGFNVHDANNRREGDV